MEHHTRPEAQIPDTLAKIAGLFQINPDLGEVVLRAYAALRGLSPEALRAHLLAPPLRPERAREAFQRPYLAHFAQTLPRYPYATDDPKEGVRIYKRENALKRVHVQVGHYPHAVLRLVVDVDLPWPQVEERIHALPLPGPGQPEIGPLPRLVRAGPHPPHAPARAGGEPEGGPGPSRGGGGPAGGLLRGGPGLQRSPLPKPLPPPPEWTWGGGKRWSLRDLHRELRGLLPSGTRRRVDPGLASYGRNNALFDRLRAEAYAHVALFRGVPGGRRPSGPGWSRGPTP